MSAIDATRPVFGNPTTESVRLNFAAAKQEIEDLQTYSATKADYLALAGGTMRGPLLLNADPTAPLGAATRQYVDNAPFLPIAGGTLRGPLLLAGEPTVPLGAATRGYVDNVVQASADAAAGRFLPLDGGTMTGRLLLSADPIEGLHAATKFYVDRTLSGAIGISEAPDDGYSYGRGNVAWQRVLPLTGGSVEGPLSILGGNALSVVAEGQPARMFTWITNVRGWSFGTLAGGEFGITDESIGAARIQIDSNGVIQGVGLSLSGTVTAAQGTFSDVQVPGTLVAGALSSAGAIGGWSLSVSHADVWVNGVFHGGLQVGGAASINGGLTLTPGDSSITAQWAGSWLSLCGTTNFGGAADFIVSGGGRTGFSFEFYWAATRIVTIDGGGNLSLTNANGFQPGGGMWAAISDVRTKRNITDYRTGLAALRRLRPISYQHNGLGDTVDDGRTFYGLTAQDVLPVMPEMVSRKLGKFRADDADEIELLTVNATPLLFAVVNGLNDLADQIDEMQRHMRQWEVDHG